MSLRKLSLVVAVVAFANADALAASAIGTWQYADSDVSMSVHLADDGRCRITAKLTQGPGVDSLCAYTLYRDGVVIDWESMLPVYPFRKPQPLRLYFYPVADVLRMEGEAERILTRWGVEKG